MNSLARTPLVLLLLLLVQTRAEVLTPAEREQFFDRYFERLTAPQPLTRFHTRSEWLKRRAVLEEQVRRCLGLSPLPERLPLDSHTTGRIEHEDYTVERVYYQVLPQIYASGYLYVPRPHPAAAGASQSNPPAPAPPNPNPNPQSPRFPAILNPHGHWDQGALHPVVQARCIALAKQGYVAFCPDSTHMADLAIGLCPIGLMTWNNMRALDYLQSLDCVEPERIGCTGASGGGQQTMYLAALDHRVKVPVPAVLVSYFRRILFVTEQTHCFCNHAPGIARATDEHEIAAMFAPRPTRFICATGDWTKDFPKEEFPDIRHIFNLAGGDVDCVQFDKPHNYDQDSREQMYAWMNRYLKADTNTAPAKEPPLTPEDPQKLKALSGDVPGNLGLEAAAACYRQKFGFRAPELRGRSQWRTYRARLCSAARQLLGEDVPPVPLNARSRGSAQVQGLKAEQWLLDTEPGVTVPGWLFVPLSQTCPAANPQMRGSRHKEALRQVAKKTPAIVIAHPGGKAALLEERSSLVRALLARGVVVLALDTRLRGELQRKWYWNTVIWGRPEEGMAAHDLNCACAWLRSRGQVDPQRVFVAGLGATGRFALFAGALDAHWAGVALDAVGPLYAEPGATNALPNVLRHGDLPQFASLIAPRLLWLNGAGGRFTFTEAAYRTLAAPAALHCSDLPAGQFDASLPDWLTRN
jgi:dienelactone hydrolase